MKLRLLALLLFLASLSPCFADGSINVSNRSLYSETAGVYHIPIWVDLNGNGALDAGEGLGTYAAALGQSANFALYVQNDPTPIAASVFRSDIYGAYVGQPAFQSVQVRGYSAGQRAPLHIEVWVGVTYQTALVRGSWDFLSRPLGGAPDDGSLPIIPPGLQGWGNTDSSGFALATPPGPLTGADLITRGSFYDTHVSIQTLLANDSDPSGGPVTFVGVDPLSNAGAAISLANGEVNYRAANPGPDFFFYTIRNSNGGVARGRVEVAINDVDGMIVFANQNIPMSSGGGLYDTRIYVDADSDGSAAAEENFGDFAITYYGQPAHLGLFLRDSDTLLAVGSFGSSADGFYLSPSSARTIVVPGVAPGSRIDLRVKAWIGPSFETSRVKGAWTFTSLPLGGVVAGGQSFPIPGLSGWGNEFSAAGYGLSPGAKPIVGNDEVTRPYRDNVMINIDTLLANDSDPEGGALIFVGADTHSLNGSEIKISGGTITYRYSVEGPDHFFYTVRTAYGAKAKGRVDIKTADPIGDIFLANRGILKSAGSELYDVPIWVDLNSDNTRGANEGLGAYAAQFGFKAYLGLFLRGDNNAFATYKFASGENGAFLESPGGTNVLVPGSIPGQRVDLTIKAWVGEHYESAFVKGSWDITSAPLGGPRPSDPAIPTPTVLGWGAESGFGFPLALGDRPIANPDLVLVPIYQAVKIPIDFILFNDSLPTNAWTLTIRPWSATGGLSATIDSGYIVFDGVIAQNDTLEYSVATLQGSVASASIQLQVQDGPAKIFLANRLVRHSAGPGVYNIPVWIDANFNGRRDAGEGIGSFANQSGQIAKLGLFLPDASSPLATARFHADASGAFLEEPAFQEVIIPGATPGSTPSLILKAWIGDDFETATLKSSWDFVPRQLGGAALAGIFEIPDVSGWGNETNNTGYAIIPGAKPKTYGHVLTRAAGQNVNAKITDLFKNDSDPEGGALTLIAVDESSREGAVITLLGDTIYYIAPLQDTGAPDYFEYTVRNSKGGIAKGRVDVVVTDAQEQFNTRLSIENTPEGNQITFRGVIGANYLIQFSDAISSPWQDLGHATDEGFGLFKIIDTNSAGVRVYRVLNQ